MKPLRPFLIAISLVLSACSSVKVTNQWKDPSWPGPPASSAVVVGISRSDSMRRNFEDTLTKQLQAAGIKAVQSYTQIPPGDEGTVKLGELIRSSNADVVIVTRVLRVEQKIDVTPAGPGYGGFYGWYGGAWASTPQVTEYKLVTLETSIWDTKTQKLAWSVTTESMGRRHISKATEQLAHTLIPKLKFDGILR